MVALRGSRRALSARLAPGLGGLLATVLTVSVGVNADPAGARPSTASTSAAGSLSASTTTGPLRWTGPRTIDPSRGNLVSISCPVAGFCAAVDQHNAFVYRAGRWSGPSYINPAGNPSRPTSGLLTAVSCASVRFCLAVDAVGNAFRFDGRRWGRPVKVEDGNLLGVSCVGKVRCLAYDDRSRVLTLDGTRVVATVDMAKGTYGVRALSCASAVFCLEVELGGDGRTYDGTTWSAPSHMIDSLPTGPGQRLGSLSCPSARFCMFIDWIQALTFDGVSWTHRDRPEAREGRISCGAADHCVYLAENGNAYTFDGTSWSTATAVEHLAPLAHLMDLSCANGSQCVALDSQGRSIEARGRTWAVPVEFDPFSGYLTGVSCSTSQSCTAIDATGHVVQSHGRFWSKPILLVPNGHLSVVSCARPWFCAAIDLAGNAWVYDGHGWRGPTVVDPVGGFTSLSCPNETFCAAINYRVFTWKAGVISPLVPIMAESVSCVSDRFCILLSDGGAWRLDGDVWLDPVYPGLVYGAQVSCGSTTFCLAVNPDGTTFLFDGAHWKYPTPMTPAPGHVSALSCASTELCTAIVGGDAITWRAGVWTAPVAVEPGRGSLVSVSCVSPSFCTAVDADGYAFVGR